MEIRDNQLKVLYKDKFKYVLHLTNKWEVVRNYFNDLIVYLDDKAKNINTCSEIYFHTSV